MNRLFMNPDRIRFLLNLFFVRYLLGWITLPIRDGKTKLEKVMMYYGKEKKDLTWKEEIGFYPIYVVIEIIRIALKWNKKYLQQEIFASPTLQRVTVNLARSIAQYGTTQPQNFASPLLVVWNFTNLCNLKCRHCYQNAGEKGIQLKYADRLRVIDQLSREYVPALALSGGEPLVDPELYTIIEVATQRGLYVSVATNGTLLTHDTCLALWDAGVQYLEISLDSSEPEYHDQFRGIPGAWQKTIDGIQNAVQTGMMVGIAPTVTRNNLSDLPRLYRLSIELGAQRFYVFNFIPTGRAHTMVQTDLSPQEREELLAFLYDCMMEKKITPFTTCPQFGRFCLEKDPQGMVITGHYSVSEGSIARVAAEYVGGCGAGRAYCAVQPDGSVTPCVFMPIQCGNLLHQTFKEIWDYSSVIVKLRDRKNYQEHCGVCDYRSVCGGCRSRAHAYFGDYLGPDPGCIYNQSAYHQLISS